MAKFAKGQSGNPGGRPKGFADFKAACQERTPAALEALDRALDLPPDEPMRMEAIKLLMAYGWGKPTQVIAADVNVSSDIVSILEGRAERARNRG